MRISVTVPEKIVAVCGLIVSEWHSDLSLISSLSLKTASFNFFFLALSSFIDNYFNSQPVQLVGASCLELSCTGQQNVKPGTRGTTRQTNPEI